MSLLSLIKEGLSSASKASTRIWTKHGKEIMVYGGVGLMAVSDILTVGATIKATRAIEEYKEEISQNDKEAKMEPKEMVKKTAKYYVPAITSFTIGAVGIIVGFRSAVTNGATAFAAYQMTDKALNELKKATKEELPEKKQKKINERVVQNRIVSNPPQTDNIVNTGRGNILFQDPFDERMYFRADEQFVRHAVFELNKDMNNSIENTVPASAFYKHLGLESFPLMDDYLWDANDGEIECEIEYTSMGDLEPCGYIVFYNQPIYSGESKYDY